MIINTVISQRRLLKSILQGAPQYCGQMLVNNAQSQVNFSWPGFQLLTIFRELFCFAIHGGVINMARVPIAEYGNLSAVSLTSLPALA